MPTSPVNFRCRNLANTICNRQIIPRCGRRRKRLEMAEKRHSSTALSWWRKMTFIFPIAVLWAIPISRALSFLKYTKNILSEEQTLNAQNDVRYGIALLIVYLICLVADLVLCLLFARKNFGVLLLL